MMVNFEKHYQAKKKPGHACVAEVNKRDAKLRAEAQLRETKLEASVAEFVSLICNANPLTQTIG